MNKLSQIAPAFRLLYTRGSLVALFVLATLSLFLVTLPTWLLDLLLVSNLFLAITLLLRSLFAGRALTLYSFPAILVLATLFRLALNVSSTKLILLRGDQGLDAAGEVIQAFGTFVVSGDFVVGFILFGIISIVNFVVIAKGSARVAEVAARFSLDALPGRQLSIDSDLRNESITAGEAQVQRAEMDRQSQFFGSMDGAMKWVQGDAIAGFVITLINAVGGVGIGVSRGMSFGDAINTFGILTVGDGLLSILPSLLISVAAGIVVTNAVGTKGEDSADQMLAQLVAEPKAPALAALTLLAVGFLGLVGIADFPFIPFFVLGAGMLAVVYFAVYARGGALELSSGRTGMSLAAERGWPLAISLPQERSLLGVVPLVIELDTRGLGPLVMKQDSPWARSFWHYAEQSAHHMLATYGLVLPQPHLRPNGSLGEGEYRILVRDRMVRSGVLRADSLFVGASESSVRAFGAQMFSSRSHPVRLSAACWIKNESPIEQALRSLGMQVLSPIEYLWLESLGALLEASDELLGIAEVKLLIQHAEPSVQQLVDELIAVGSISYPELTEVFRRLVRERVSIKDTKRIVEGIAEFTVMYPKDRESRAEWLLALHEFLRLLLMRAIVAQCSGPSGILRTFLLSKEVEEEFEGALSSWDNVRTPPPIEPRFAQGLRESSQRLFSPVLERGALPIVLVCGSETRLAVQEFFTRQYPTTDWLRTISYEELRGAQHAEVVSVLHVSV